jgi:hypothetical protein
MDILSYREFIEVKGIYGIYVLNTRIILCVDFTYIYHHIILYGYYILAES